MFVTHCCVLVGAAAQSDVLLLSLTCSIELLPEGKLLPIAIDPSINASLISVFLS